jgi:uncharacterized cupredoxin-like copper-binding protein
MDAFLAFLPYALLFLACPLMMLFMYRGGAHEDGHARHHADDRAELARRAAAKDALEHEFMAGRHAVAGAGYKVDWLARAKSDHAGGHGMDHQGTGVRVQPKNNATLTISVPAESGEFEFGCFIPGHYESGMKGKLVVE